MQRIPITKAGFEKLERELKHYKSVERPNAIDAIAEARAHGDLSENAEYDAAKENQGFVEGRINELEDMVARAEVVDPVKIESDCVTFAATVDLLDVDSDQEITYSIVGDYESAPEKGRLAVSSPVARALLGREVEDEVTVKTPGGNRYYEIMDIRFTEIVADEA